MGIGYLTPNTIPADTICRTLFIPNDELFIAVVTGALNSLVDADQWTPYGTLTPQQSADALRDMFDGFCFQQGTCRVIGEIISYASGISPDVRWLVCDGASYLRADYPDLFIVIGTAFGSADASHFNVPDLRGRAPIGLGTGPGLSTRVLGDYLGEEDHTLTVAELASHTHADTGHTHGESVAAPTAIAIGVGVPAPSALPAVGITGAGSAALANSGGGSAHNTIQPSTVINFFIVALE